MKMVMVDMDGVLINKTYKTTADIRSFVRRIPSIMRIIPNSDTPIERLAKSFADLAGLAPDTIIGEKGAVILHNGVVCLTCSVQGIGNYIAALKKAFASLDCDVVTGDSVTWIREGKVFVPNRRMLIIDGLRRQTVGFYLRATDKSGLACLDDDWFHEGAEVVKKIPIPFGLESKDFNPKYGIVVMNAVGVKKTDGYRFLSKQHPEDAFYMIGDGDADVIDDNSVIHCAVANASTKLKAVASFTSDKEVTSGLIECLRWIAEHE